MVESVVKIAVDLMGGEGSGNRNLQACMDYPAPEELVLVGDQDRLDPASVGQLRERGVNILLCSKALTGLESPPLAETDPILQAPQH